MQKFLTYDDVFLIPNKSNIDSRDLPDTTAKLNDLTFKIPIISANMDTITEHEMAIAMWKSGAVGALHRFNAVADSVKEYELVRQAGAECFVSVGVKGEKNSGEHLRALELYQVGARYFIVDVAHGHCELVHRMVGQLRDSFGDGITIVAGNVATPEAVKDLANWGVNVVKCGVGPGSICSTRLTTGFGVPMFSCLLECCKAADEVGVQVIADGGVKTSGDVVKALVAGADAVMLGSLLAGCDETPGQVQTDYETPWKSKSYKLYRGMASRDVQNEIGNGDRVAAEGVSRYVLCKGPVGSVVKELAGGIRSGMSYGDALTIGELPVKVKWDVQTVAGYFEGTPHFKT